MSKFHSILFVSHGFLALKQAQGFVFPVRAY